MHDDFLLSTDATGMTDANGHVQLQLPAALVNDGDTGRFIHVTAGPKYPLVEKIIALP
jgi:hypothetical protein